jgi:hypothetical protein
MKNKKLVACGSVFAFLFFVNNSFSEDWKGWKEWRWERPALDDVLPPEGESPLAMVLEFKSTWDPIFAQYPNAADGFLVFHVASMGNTEDVTISLKLPEGVILNADSPVYTISYLAGNVVQSYFVPIKLMSETGEFLVESSIYAPETFSYAGASLYIIREHRRKIYALSPSEYTERKLEKMLEGVYKRPGAEYYSPYYLSVEGKPYTEDMNFLVVDEPSWEGIDFQSLGIHPVPNEEIPNDFEMEESEISEQDPSASYTFKGTIIFRGPYSYRICFLNSCWNSYAYVLKGATVKVYDKDISWDDFICETTTDEYGYFQCSGSAYDFGSYPDPYIVVYSENNFVKVRNCLYWPYQFRTGIFDNRASGTIDIGGWYIADNPSMPATQALWVFNYALPTYAKNKQVWGGDIGSYSFKVPCVLSNCGQNACYSHSTKNIYIPSGAYTRAPSVIAHEFGHALMDKFYNFSNNPNPGGSHWNCGIIVNNNFVCSPQDPGLAWSEGFATANSFFVFNTQNFCWGGLPWGPTNSGDGICNPGRNFEGSTIHRNYDNPQNRWINRFCQTIQHCGEILDSTGQPVDQRLEAYVASALLDGFDYTNNIDMDCDFHHSQGRNACDQTPDPYFNSNYAWWRTLLALQARPQNFFEFAEALIPKGSSINECLERDAIRATARFNGIALEGLFGVTGYEGCCAVSQAVLSAAENNIMVDGYTVTSSEGERIKNNLRLFRDQKLAQYPKGKQYINLYYANSDEIAKIITSDLELIVRTIRILRFASDRYEHFDELLSSNTPVLDGATQEEIKYLIGKLKTQGSAQLQDVLASVEFDFENIKNMNASEMLNYLGR